MNVDVELNGGPDDTVNAWEGAGVVWSSMQGTITSVQYTNGSYDANKNGVFGANFKLQFSTDGVTWVDSGWTASSAYAYDTSAAAGVTYTFTGSATSKKRARASSAR